MSAYIQGNLALEEKRSNGKTSEKIPAGGSKHAQRPKGLPTPEKLLYLLTVIVFCVAAGWIAFRYAFAFELNSQIVKVETEIRQLEEENASLKNEVAKLQDPQRLIEAGIQIGLVQPSELPAQASSSHSEAAVAMSAAQ